MKSKVVLVLILVLAFFLRVWRLDSLELFGDELDVGYHAYSLWTTGSDYMGQKLPTYIHSFPEWRAPLLMYFTAPFVGLLGLNEWGVRLPPIIFGLFNILLIYCLVKLLAKNEKTALVSAFILAIIPWHIHYSRTAFEVTLLLALVLIGTIVFLKQKWLLAAISFGLSFYAYSTANVFVPLWLGTLMFVFKDKLKKSISKMAFPVGVFLIFLLPITLSVFGGQGSDRFNLISIFNNPETVDRIVFKRNTGVSPATERFFYNKLTGWSKEFFSNYLTAFSPQFLFLDGDPNPRHNPPGFGQLYLILAPFLLIGVWQLLKSKNKPLKKLIFAWLLLAPIASSLTVGGGNQATRLFLMLTPLTILISLGVVEFPKDFRFLGFALNRLGFVFVFSVLVLGLLPWFHEYRIHYPKETHRWWHYGYKESISWLKENDDYQRVIINNSHEPALIRYLFWFKEDPGLFRQHFSEDKEKENFLPGFNGFGLDKTIFGRINQEDKMGWLRDNLDKDSVYLAFQKDEVPGDWDWSKEPPEGLSVLKTIYDPWGDLFAYWVTSEN